MADSPERPLVPPLVPAVAAAASLALVALRLAHVIGWAWQWLVSPLWGVAVAGWACVVAVVALDALNPRTILNDPEQNGTKLTDMTPEQVTPEVRTAGQVACAAWHGYFKRPGVISVDGAWSAVAEAVLGTDKPDGYDWRKDILDLTWQCDDYRDRLRDLKARVSALATKFSGCSASDFKAATEQGGTTALGLRGAAQAEADCARQLQELIGQLYAPVPLTDCPEPHPADHRCFDCATDDELAASIPPFPGTEARCHCREQEPPHDHETDEDGDDE